MFRIKYAILIAIIAVALTACQGAPPPETPALLPDEQPAEIYEQKDGLVAADDYGQLYPYIGEISPITYFAGEKHLFGLADANGRVALEPRLIRVENRATTEGEPYWALVDVPEYRPDDLLWRQLASLDGSWTSNKYLCSDMEYNQERVIVLVGDNKTAYDLSGQLLGDTPLATAIFTGGLAPVYDSELGAMYYIDTAGQRAFAQDFRYAEPFYNGLAVVSTEAGTNGIINRKGAFIIPEGRYTYISAFTEEFSTVGGQNGLVGLIDSTGREIFPPLYNQFYWLDEEKTMMAAHLDWQIYLLDLSTGSAELLPDGQGYYGEGWYYSQDRESKNLILYKGEITRSFSVAEETDWGNRLECHYLGGDLFALSYQYRAGNGEIDKERSRLDIYNAASDKVVRSIPRYAFRGHQQNGYYEIYDWNMWGEGETMLLDKTSLEPLFGQSFEYISYLGDGLYSVLTGNEGGLMKADGSWLLHVNIDANIAVLKDEDTMALVGFSFGDEANYDIVEKTEEYYNGGQIFRLKNGQHKDLYLFFSLEGEKFSGFAAKAGNVFGLEIGIANKDSIINVFGEPDVYEEASDADGTPLIIYHFDTSSLYFTMSEYYVLTNINYKYNPAK